MPVVTDSTIRSFMVWTATLVYLIDDLPDGHDNSDSPNWKHADQGRWARLVLSLPQALVDIGALVGPVEHRISQI